MFKQNQVVALLVGLSRQQWEPGPKNIWGFTVVDEVKEGIVSLKGFHWFFNAETGHSTEDNTEIRAVLSGDREVYERQMLERRVNIGLEEWSKHKDKSWWMETISSDDLAVVADVLEKGFQGLTEKVKWPYRDEVEEGLKETK